MAITCKTCGAIFGECAFEPFEIKRGDNVVMIYRPICPHCFAPQYGDY